jgi:ABC-type polysaccharide/polyol phosphate export permease
MSGGLAPPTTIRDRMHRVVAYRTLVKYLVLKDIKVKSRGTYLGVAWTLMNPALSIGAYFVTFRYIFRVQIPNHLSFFLVGFLMWVFFSRAVTSAATCIIDNEGLVKRSAFPLEVLPVSSVLYHLFHHGVALGLVLPVMLLFGGARLSWHLSWVLLFLVAFAAFTAAVALWVSTIGVFVRDIRDILEVGFPILFWGTPILYSPEMAPAVVRPLLDVNPVTGFLGVVRSGLLDGHLPAAGDLVRATLWLVVTVGSGLWLFSRVGPRLAEEI